jgi:hypothetical protein
MKLDTTSVLAIWGAILSSVTFGWNLFRDLRDRPDVKLKGTFGQLVTDTVGRLHFASMKFIESQTDNDPNVPTQFKLTITNTGRRRVRIEGWAGIRGRGMPKAFHLSRGLPKILDEGESHEELTDEPLKILAEDVKRIVAWDSAGREWKLSRCELRRLKKEAKELAQKGYL